MGQRLFAVLLLALDRDHVQFGAAAVAADLTQMAARELHQVRRHLGRRQEAGGGQRAVDGALGHRHVRIRGPVGRHGHAQAEHGAKRWLVPAWEHAARVGGFKLRAQHQVLGAAGRGVFLHEQAEGTGFNLAREAEAQLVTTGRRRLGQRNRGQLRLVVGHHAVHRLAIEQHLTQLLVQRVELDGGSGLLEVQRDAFSTGHAARGGVRRQRDGVLQRHHILRQAAGCRGEGKLVRRGLGHHHAGRESCRQRETEQVSCTHEYLLLLM